MSDNATCLDAGGCKCGLSELSTAGAGVPRKRLECFDRLGRGLFKFLQAIQVIHVEHGDSLDSRACHETPFI
jgi:hypothetical protein